MSRFDCPSASLTLRLLLKEARYVLWTGLILAIAAHMALTQFRSTGQEQKAVKPLTTQFVKREPRLTKPLEMKKRPRPKRRPIQRKMVSVKARVSRNEMSSRIQATEVIRNLVRPKTTVARAIGFDQIDVEPSALAQTIEGSREARHAVDMSLEMVDVEALDTGRYQAMVIQDPTDKRNIKGYLHLVLIHIMTITQMASSNILHTDLGIKRLIDSLNELTDIKADVTITSDLTSPEALRTPWIYITTYKPFELNPVENEAVGRYTTSGGFLFCDEHIHVATATYISVPKAFVRMFALGFETQGVVEGREWYTGKVPNDHPLFHCYFDFEGPPIGYTWSSITQWPIYLEEPMIGVFLRDTLVGIITRRSYAAPWYGKGWSLGSPNDMQQVGQRRRALEFGINTIIYALTREGSITSQVMDMIQ